MARGQDAPAVRGGQLDPYVAQSMETSKQAASNRLLTAMQEAGATQRTEMQIGAQKEAAERSAQASVDQSRIQAAAQDRRSAGTIRRRSGEVRICRMRTRGWPESDLHPGRPRCIPRGPGQRHGRDDMANQRSRSADGLLFGQTYQPQRSTSRSHDAGEQCCCRRRRLGPGRLAA